MKDGAFPSCATMPRGAGSLARDLWGFRASVLLLLAYAAIHLLLRLGLATSIGVDHSIEQVFAQTLSAGYDMKQPPLYTWLLWLVQQATGPTMFSFLVLKYALLLFLFIFYYRIAERLFAEPRFAALTAWSILLLYQIGWNSHEGVTQTQVLSAACAGTLLAFLRVAERPTWDRYVLLGAAVAVGFLSKLSFGAFVVSLVAAALCRPAYRSALLSPRLVATIGAALVLVSPYLWWMTGQAATLPGLYAETLASGGAAETAARIGAGLWSTVLSSLGFLSPLLPLLVILFPGAVRLRLPDSAPVSQDLERLVRDMLLASAAILVAGVLFAGVTAYKERWLHPFYLAAPLYFFARVRRSEPKPGRIRLYLALFVAIAVAAMGVRAARLAVGPPLCSYCLPQVPYKPLTDAIADAGFRTGTILSPRTGLAANLRAAFPDARIYALRHPNLSLPTAPRDAGRKCLVVWPDDTPWESFSAEALRYLDLDRSAEAAFDVKSVVAPWEHLWLPTGFRTSSWKFVLFDGPRGQCR